MDFESRLTRLRDRRAGTVFTPLGKRVDKQTPFGLTGLSRQRFSPTEPQTTARLKDFKGAKRMGAKYMHWVKKIRKAEKWRQMGKAIDNNDPTAASSFTPNQKMAAALIHSTTHHSEPRRFGGADKLARSAIRAKGQDENEGVSFEHLFPMAEGDGAHAYQEVLDGKRKLSKKQKKVIEDMSDSSDDEG